MVTFGERLSQLRKEKDLYQSELGELVSCSPSAIGQYERNEREPSYRQLYAFADLFDVSLDYLMGKTNERMTVEQYIRRDSFELSEILDNYTLSIQGNELTEHDKKRIKDISIAILAHKLNI